jgi:hypothetical protein
MWKPLVVGAIVFGIIIGVALYVKNVYDNKAKEPDLITWQAKRVPNHSLVIRVEKCEYLILIAPGGQWVITHKGNCDNPVHRR